MSGKAPAKQLRRNAGFALDLGTLFRREIPQRGELTVGRHGTGGVFLKCVNQVIQCSLEYGEEPQTRHGEADGWSYPRISVDTGQPLSNPITMGVSYLGSAVHPVMNIPAVKMTEPKAMGGKRASGTTLFPTFSTILLYRN